MLENVLGVPVIMWTSFVSAVIFYTGRWFYLGHQAKLLSRQVSRYRSELILICQHRCPECGHDLKKDLDKEYGRGRMKIYIKCRDCENVSNWDISRPEYVRLQ